MGAKRKSYTPAYRREAAHLVIDSRRRIAEVAREIGVGEQLLGRWVAIVCELLGMSRSGCYAHRAHQPGERVVPPGHRACVQHRAARRSRRAGPASCGVVSRPTPGPWRAYIEFATCDPQTALADAALRDRGVPDGFTVFKVDLPTMSELADRYGVTKPDTFVQVDRAGNRVRSWTGSPDGADVAAHAAQ
jgi:Transposase